MGDIEIRDTDLPEDLQALVEIIGFENTLALVRFYSGERVYFPKAESVMRLARNRRIREDFTGLNHRELCKRYNLTEPHIRAILAGRDPEEADDEAGRPKQACIF